MNYDLDEQFNEERKTLADLDYTEPIPFVEEEDDIDIDEGEIVCSCDVDPDYCELHAVKE